MQEGKRIWVESLLTDEEYRECAKKYPTTYVNGPVKVPMFECEFKWRWRMGGSSTEEEIKLFNSRLDAVFKAANIKARTEELLPKDI